MLNVFYSGQLEPSVATVKEMMSMSCSLYYSIEETVSKIKNLKTFK